MRKIFIALLFCMIGMTAYAQKGMQGVGGNLEMHINNGVSDDWGSDVWYGLDLKYLYNVSNYGRIELSASFYLGNEPTYMGSFSYHQFLNGVRRVRPYLIAGIGYGNIQFWYDYERCTYNCFLIRAGLGLDYRITHKLSLQSEITGAATIDEENYLAPQIKLGLAYNF